MTRRGTATMMGLSKQTNEAFPVSSRCQNTPAALKPSLGPSKRSSKCLSSKAVLCYSISDHGHTTKAFSNKVLQQLTALSPLQEPDKNPLLDCRSGQKVISWAKPEGQDQNADFPPHLPGLFVSPPRSVTVCSIRWGVGPIPALMKQQVLEAGGTQVGGGEIHTPPHPSPNAIPVKPTQGSIPPSSSASKRCISHQAEF